MELLDALANQGPTSLSTPAGPTTSKTDQIVSHIELAAFNIHGLCNELRPRQARETLKLIMRQQAREKRLKAARVIQSVLSSPPSPLFFFLKKKKVANFLFDIERAKTCGLSSPASKPTLS
jgi:heme exporter protein D